MSPSPTQRRVFPVPGHSPRGFSVKKPRDSSPWIRLWKYTEPTSLPCLKAASSRSPSCSARRLFRAFLSSSRSCVFRGCFLGPVFPRPSRSPCSLVFASAATLLSCDPPSGVCLLNLKERLQRLSLIRRMHVRVCWCVVLQVILYSAIAGSFVLAYLVSSVVSFIVSASVLLFAKVEPSPSEAHTSRSGSNFGFSENGTFEELVEKDEI